jgi:uncharacterized protein YbgA (DUF1722 family)/uncharacterized protein YbbK (DUF523 family)
MNTAQMTQYKRSDHLENKIRIGVSRCLLGEKVRYDGGHKLDHYITETLTPYFDFVGVCPEVECGLSVPREAMHLTGNPENPSLVTIKNKVDHTDRMLTWANQRITELEDENLSGFIFKSRSPSSGMQGVKIYGDSAMVVNKGAGLFARAFMNHFPLLPVEDEGRLNDATIRENFLERVFVYYRWQQFEKGNRSARDFLRFHTDHKLLILAHSTRHYTELGRLVAGASDHGSGLYTAYITLLMEGLRLNATVKKNTNVLQHIMGYFKKQLTSDEKEELLEVIVNYQTGLIPLIVPVVLLRHYVRKYNQPYLTDQYYLKPHPIELMLRNHV